MHVSALLFAFSTLISVPVMEAVNNECESYDADAEASESEMDFI